MGGGEEGRRTLDGPLNDVFFWGARTRDPGNLEAAVANCHE